MPPNQNQNVRIWWDSSVAAYRLAVPYNQTFTELFKQLIPHSDRAWHPDSKIWTITEKYFDPTATLLKKMFGGAITIISRDAAEKVSAPPPVKLAPLDQVLLQFIKLLPHEAAQSAYRKAALLLHPDKGGDMEKMANLNTCWQRIEEEFYKTKKAGG